MKLTEAGSYGLVCFPSHPKTFLRDCSSKKEKPRTRKTGGAPRSAPETTISSWRASTIRRRLRNTCSMSFPRKKISTSIEERSGSMLKISPSLASKASPQKALPSGSRKPKSATNIGSWIISGSRPKTKPRVGSALAARRCSPSSTKLTRSQKPPRLKRPTRTWTAQASNNRAR